MIHQFQGKKRISQRKKIIQGIIIFVGFFAFIYLGILSWAGQIFNSVGNPIWKAEKFISDGMYSTNYVFRTKESITNENHNLIEEISALRLTMVDYQILKKENEELKEILNRLETKNNFVLGNILTKPNHSPYDTIIIDVGTVDNMKEMSVVYANGNVPVGYISKVYNQTSLVTLYSSPGQKTEGFIDGSNASVELSGRGGGNFEMVVPLELQVDKGTIVYFPNSTSLVVALVEEVISAPTDPFKKVILSSPVNVQNLKWVQVKMN